MTSHAQINMQEQQLKTCEIRSESVLELLSQTPRKEFVPERFRDVAYSDFRIPLDHGQTMMTPLEEATIIQTLGIQSHHTVLEIGTGSGYLTALMAKQAKHVISIDYYESFTHSVQKKLLYHAISNVTLITGDGIHGYLDKAPYDRIVLTGSIEHIDRSFHPQLVQDGKLVAIIGKSPAMEACLLTLNSAGKWNKQVLFDTNITPLIERYRKDNFQL